MSFEIVLIGVGLVGGPEVWLTCLWANLEPGTVLLGGPGAYTHRFQSDD
jgi:hypothetical protein